jgi:DNA-binding response OmpR family regulator
VPYRVLLVDDYPEVASALCQLLVTYGHDCRTASTGGEAIEVAHAFQPELVLVDLDLPDLSGYEVARHLREHAAGKPFIAAMTGTSDTARRNDAYAAGFDHYVVKPIDAGIARRIIQLYERARTDQSTRNR